MDKETANYIEVKQGGRHLLDSNQFEYRLQRYRHIETSEFVTIELHSFLVCCFIKCIPSKDETLFVVFDFYHNK